MANRIQYRRDTKARWLSINPILMEGEVGYETDTHCGKVGDGVHTYSELPYERGTVMSNITNELGDDGNLVISQSGIKNIIDLITKSLKRNDYPLNIAEALFKGFIFKTQNKIDFNPSSLSTGACFIGKVKKGDVFTFVNFNRFGSIAIYAIYDLEGNRIKISEESKLNEDIEIEKDGYLIINSSVGVNTTEEKIIPKVLNSPKDFFSIMLEVSILPILASKMKENSENLNTLSNEVSNNDTIYKYEMIARSNYGIANSRNLNYNDFTPGVFPAEAGSKLDVSKLDVSIASRKHFIMNLYDTDNIEILSILGTDVFKPYILLDKDFVVLEVSENNFISSSIEITIPAEAKYIVFQTTTEIYCKIEINKQQREENFNLLFNNTKKEKSINILCFGNSFTQDSFSYVPYLLHKLCPSLQFNIGMAVIGGCSLAQHAANFINDTVNLNGTDVAPQNYRFAISSSTDVAWKAWANWDVDRLLNYTDWDIITFQQNGANAFSEYETYFEPFLIKIQKAIFGKIKKSTKLGWILTHGSYSNNPEIQLERWRGTVENTKKIINSTMFDVVFPYGTAIQNLRNTPLNDIADTIGLLADDVHLQEGVATLSAAYTNVLKILELLGIFNISIIGDKTKITEEFNSSINVQGANYGTKGIVGMTENGSFLAQLSAIMANKRPYELTNINNYYEQ